jgi:hypothetical protein
MKIKILVSISGSMYHATPGDVLTVDADEAKRLIDAGFAMPEVAQPEVAAVANTEKRGKK